MLTKKVPILMNDVDVSPKDKGYKKFDRKVDGVTTL